MRTFNILESACRLAGLNKSEFLNGGEKRSFQFRCENKSCNLRANATFSGDHILLSINSCLRVDSMASFFQETSDSSIASTASLMVNQALSRSHDFFSPRMRSCERTSS